MFENNVSLLRISSKNINNEKQKNPHKDELVAAKVNFKDETQKTVPTIENTKNDELNQVSLAFNENNVEPHQEENNRLDNNKKKKQKTPIGVYVIPPVSKSNQELAKDKPLFDDSVIVKQISPLIRRKFQVELPNKKFEHYTIQTNESIDEINKSIKEIDENVSKTNEEIKNISEQLNTISEKSERITQTADYVYKRLSIMGDWVDGLESSGSMFKITLIEWAVKFLTFLSSLFLLLWNPIKKLFRFGKKSNIRLSNVSDIGNESYEEEEGKENLLKPKSQ